MHSTTRIWSALTLLAASLLVLSPMACIDDTEVDDWSYAVFSGEPDAGEADAGCEGEEPECPSEPPGFEPQDPGIPSGAECRGACGGDCPDTCRDLPDQHDCIEYQDEECKWHSIHCDYTGLIECGSHAGCRDHDDCYDSCALLDNRIQRALCRRGCDNDCIRDHGAVNCARWATGRGPYDSWIQFSPGVTQSGPFETTCF